MYKYILKFESFNESITTEFVDNNGEYQYKKDNSYINFEILRDTYNIVEFNSELNLEDVYNTIGDRGVLITKIYLDPNDSPILIKKFLKDVENFCIDNDERVIMLVAEPFGDKRQNKKRLVEFYSNCGFDIFSNIGKGVLMYKHI